MSYFWQKLFNKKKYQENKYKKQTENKLNFYNLIVKNKLSEINNSLKDNQELSFLHSGHLGDLIYSLPLVKELSKKYKCNFLININKKNETAYENHPSGSVMINKRTAELLIPLLKEQKYINKVKIFNKEKIHINLDLFREIPVSINFHSVRWYSHLTGTPLKMEESCLSVNNHHSEKNKIVIMRSPRYRNQYINYQFLKETKNIVCIGLESEYQDLKKSIPNLEFYECKDFLEMAEIIKSSRFFIGNLCFAYSLAESLKVPRLLESCPDFPIVFPVGGEGYDFFHQEHFEKYFHTLNNRNN
jgi:hypothetical protein